MTDCICILGRLRHKKTAAFERFRFKTAEEQKKKICILYYAETWISVSKPMLAFYPCIGLCIFAVSVDYAND